MAHHTPRHIALLGRALQPTIYSRYVNASRDLYLLRPEIRHQMNTTLGQHVLKNPGGKSILTALVSLPH